MESLRNTAKVVNSTDDNSFSGISPALRRSIAEFLSCLDVYPLTCTSPTLEESLNDPRRKDRVATLDSPEFCFSDANAITAARQCNYLTSVCLSGCTKVADGAVVPLSKHHTNLGSVNLDESFNLMGASVVPLAKLCLTSVSLGNCESLADDLHCVSTDATAQELSTATGTMAGQGGVGPRTIRRCFVRGFFLPPPPPANQCSLTGLAGLRNSGNQCYVNASLQALMHVPAFAAAVRRKVDGEIDSEEDGMQGGPSKVTLRHSLRALAEEMLGGRHAPVNPQEVQSCVRRELPEFDNEKQQDAEEFVRAVLNKLEAEGLGEALEAALGHKEQHTLFPHHHQQEQQQRCHTRESHQEGNAPPAAAKVRVQRTSGVIGVEIPADARTARPAKRQSAKRARISGGSSSSASSESSCLSSHSVPLAACLASAVATQPLESAEWSAQKTAWSALGSALLLSVNRTDWSQGGRPQKLHAQLVVPFDGLDMTPFMATAREGQQQEQRAVYDLQSFVVHDGRSLAGGHYTAYALVRGNWHHFDDELVIPVDKPVAQIAAGQATILCFARRF